MTYLAFRGQHRTAARHLLDNTPLGDTLELFGVIHDADDFLQVMPEREQVAAMSNGERALLKFLSSLHGTDACNLWSLVQDIDRDCQLACIWALGLLTGHFAQMTPVRFEALP